MTSVRPPNILSGLIAEVMMRRFGIGSQAVLGLTMAMVLGSHGARAASAQNSRNYTITVAPVSGQSGKLATAHVVVRPAQGFHMNVSYPAAIKLETTPGVTLQKTQYGRSDGRVDEREISFDVGLTAANPGRYSVKGQLRFAVSTDTASDPHVEPVTIEMTIK